MINKKKNSSTSDKLDIAVAVMAFKMFSLIYQIYKIKSVIMINDISGKRRRKGQNWDLKNDL